MKAHPPLVFDAGLVRCCAGFALRAPRRHPLLAALCFGGVLSLCLLALQVLPKSYRVQASLAVEPARPALRGATASNSWHAEEYEAVRDAIETVMTPASLAGLIRELDLLPRWERSRPAPLRWLGRLRKQKATPDEQVEALAKVLAKKVSLTTRMDRVLVEVEWTDADGTASIASGLLHSFQEARKEVAVGALTEAIGILSAHDADLREEIESLAKPGEGKSGRGRDATLASRLAKVRDAIRELELSRDRKAARMRQDLGDLRLKHGDDDPGVESLEQRIAALANPSAPLLMLREHEKLLTEELLAQASTHGDSGRARDDQSALMAKERVLRARIDDAHIELSMQAATLARRYSVIEPAEPPKEAYSPSALGMIASGLLAGLLLAILACVRIDARDGVVWESWQLERLVSLPVLARLPGDGRTPPASFAAQVGTLLLSEWRLLLTCAFLGLACTGLAGFSGGNPVLAALPVILPATVWAVRKMPLRWTAYGLLTILLALDQEWDAQGLWHTPLHKLKDLFVYNLGDTLHVPAIKVNGLEVTLLLLLGLAAWRKAIGSRIDSQGQQQSAGVVGDFLLVWIASLIFVCVNGVLKGAPTAVLIWHARPVVAYLLLTLLFQIAFRGSRDHAVVGRLLVFAAIWKAILATWFWNVVRPQVKDLRALPIEYATNHWDSITFTMGCVILLASLTVRFDRKRIATCCLLLPIILMGIVSNNRRLAWVQLGMAILLVILLSPWKPWKRAVVRGAIASIPVALLYIGAGWSSNSAIFGPVQMLRSVADGTSDRSTLDRDVENWNLVLSIKESPLLGRGFGHEYTEYVVGDDISGSFPMYRALPHNSILGWLLFAGLFGFTGLWSLWVLVVFLAARSYRLARTANDRVVALCCMCTILICVAQAFGDLGLSSLQSEVYIALAITFSGKLAVATGAWPARRASRKARLSVSEPLRSAA